MLKRIARKILSKEIKSYKREISKLKKEKSDLIEKQEEQNEKYKRYWLGKIEQTDREIEILKRKNELYNK